MPTRVDGPSGPVSGPPSGRLRSLPADGARGCSRLARPAGRPPVPRSAVGGDVDVERPSDTPVLASRDFASSRVDADWAPRSRLTTWTPVVWRSGNSYAPRPSRAPVPPERSSRRPLFRIEKCLLSAPQIANPFRTEHPGHPSRRLPCSTSDTTGSSPTPSQAASVPGLRPFLAAQPLAAPGSGAAKRCSAALRACPPGSTGPCPALRAGGRAWQPAKR